MFVGFLFSSSNFRLLLGVEDTAHVTIKRRLTNLLFLLFSSFFCPFVLYCFTSSVFSTPSKGPIFKTSKEKKTKESKRHEEVTSRKFVVGLVSATVTEVACIYSFSELVDIVRTAVLSINVAAHRAFTMLINADLSFDCTISHVRMISTQPGREGCTTCVFSWRICYHFCTCSSYETVPAVEFNIACRIYVVAVIFSFRICQILVSVTFIN